MTPLALVNPTAGGGRAGQLAEGVLERFGPLDIRYTTGPGHATALVAAARGRGVHRFLSVGGDGTLHEVVTGALRVEGPRPVIGLCPLGTGNSFGRDIDVRDIEAAAAAWMGGFTTPSDVLRVEHAGEVLYSINLVGLGFSAAVGALTNRRFKALGAAGYIAAVLVEVVRLGAPSMHFWLDGDEHQGPAVMLSLCNSRYTGGDMCMAPSAKINDGQLDVIRLDPVSRLRLLTAFPKIFAGTHPHMPEMLETTAQRVEFERVQPVEVMLDGEVFLLQLRSVEVVPQAVEIACPR